MKITKEQIEEMSKADIIETMLVMLEVLGKKMDQDEDVHKAANYPVSKTMFDWLKELPHPIGVKAIANTPEENLKSVYNNASSALTGAFAWIKSPEGYDYWDKIYDDLRKKESF